jgi:hypothetical protein
VGYGILVIRDIVGIGVSEVGVVGFQFKEHQWNAVYKPNHIRATVIKLADHLQLAYGKKMIVFGVVEIKNGQALLLQVAVLVEKADGYAFFQQLDTFPG